MSAGRQHVRHVRRLTTSAGGQHVSHIARAHVLGPGHAGLRLNHILLGDGHLWTGNECIVGDWPEIVRREHVVRIGRRRNDRGGYLCGDRRLRLDHREPGAGPRVLIHFVRTVTTERRRRNTYRSSVSDVHVDLARPYRKRNRRTYGSELAVVIKRKPWRLIFYFQTNELRKAEIRRARDNVLYTVSPCVARFSFGLLCDSYRGDNRYHVAENTARIRIRTVCGDLENAGQDKTAVLPLGQRDASKVTFPGVIGWRPL